MPQVIIDNLRGGLSFSDRMGKENSYYIGRAADFDNPLYEGYLSPGAKAVNVSSTPSAISSMELDNVNTKMYLIEAATKLHKLHLVAQTLAGAAEWPHTISSTSAGGGGGTIVGEDVKVYPIGTTNYLFYSYNGFSSTSGSVGRCALTGAAAFDDDFISKEPTTPNTLGLTVPHPMLEWGENGYLYIADGRYLHAFNGQTAGANGQFKNEELTLPYGWVITSLFDAGDYIGITAMYKSGTWSWPDLPIKGRGAVFFWDGTSDHWNKRVAVNDPEIRASQSINGDFFIFCRNHDGEGTIRKWNGSKFVLVDKMRQNSAGVPLNKRLVPGYGSVIAHRDNLIVGGSKWEVFRMDENNNISAPFVSNPTVTSDNAISYAVGSWFQLIYHSFKDATTYYLNKFSLAKDNPYFVFKTLYYKFPQKIRINYIKLCFQAIVSGTDDDIYLETDYGKNNKLLGSISYAADGAIYEKKFSGKGITCNSFRVNIDTDETTATDGIVYAKIIVDYSPLIGDL